MIHPMMFDAQSRWAAVKDALEAGDVEKIKFWRDRLPQYPCTLRPHYDTSLAHWAVKKGAVLLLQPLAGLGVPFGNFRLINVAIESGSIACIKTLVRLGCNVSPYRQNVCGSAMDVAIGEDSVAAARALLGLSISVHRAVRKASVRTPARGIREIVQAAAGFEGAHPSLQRYIAPPPT